MESNRMVTLVSYEGDNGLYYKSDKKWEELEDNEIAYLGEYDIRKYDLLNTLEREIAEDCYPCTKEDMIQDVQDFYQHNGCFEHTPKEFAERVAKDIYNIADASCFETYLYADSEEWEDLVIEYGGCI